MQTVRQMDVYNVIYKNIPPTREVGANKMIIELSNYLSELSH